MRLSRIITAIAIGLAVIGAPAAAGAAQPFTPQPPVPPTQTVTPQPPPYPPTTPALTADRLSVPVGDPVTLTGTGWPANSGVRLDFALNPTALRLPAPAPAAPGGTGAMVPVGDRLLAWGRPIPSIYVRTDSAGRFTRSVTFNDPGTVLITATSLTPGRQTASLTLTVTGGPHPPPPSHGGGTMPVTGSSIGPQIGVGVAAVLAGALLLWLGYFRRRRIGERGAAA